MNSWQSGAFWKVHEMAKLLVGVHLHHKQGIITISVCEIPHDQIQML